MPRLPAAFGVILTAALCIGLAVLRYPQVNQQVWEMVQAGRQRTADGQSGVLWLGLAIPDQPTLARSQGNQSEQISAADPASNDETSTNCDAVTFAPVPIAQYVGTDQGNEQGRNDAATETDPDLPRQETVQITLAVPPQMAILDQPERDHMADDALSDRETAEDVLPPKQNEPEHQDSSRQSAASSSRPSQPLFDSRISTSDEPAADDVGAFTTSGVNSAADPVGNMTSSASNGVGHLAGGNGNAAPEERDDFVDPPLVPIVRDEVAAAPQSVTDTSDFELVAPHDAVARLAPSPQVTLPTDLPLVNVYRNQWFSVERPQRLPPVHEESQGGVGSSDSQGPWDWTPSIPLYPSTGR